MDVNCGSYLQKHTKLALQQNKVSEYDIDRALLNLFSVRIRLGLFNGDPTKLPYGNISPNDVCSPAHQALALEAARNGIVLLKNNLKLLPFSKRSSSSLAVIGPNAYVAKTLLGNYAGPPCKAVTPLDALRGYVKNAVYHKGCDSVACSNAAIDQAVAIARNADRVVLIMGLDQTQEKEDMDRVDLSLPGKQRELITSVANATKKPVVLVLICGGPVDISFATNNDKIGSIIWAGYPGEAGGIALAEIIFGDHNPGESFFFFFFNNEGRKLLFVFYILILYHTLVVCRREITCDLVSSELCECADDRYENAVCNWISRKDLQIL